MLSRVRRSLRRSVLGHRRLIAFVLTALAVFAGVRALAPPSASTASVLVAARDLDAGTQLAPTDLVTRHVTPALVPDGALTNASGRVLAGALRRGEPVTDARVVGPSLARDGLTAVPVRLPDAAMAALLRAGDRVELYATDPTAGGTTRVATDVLVLAVPPRSDPQNAVTSSLSGRLVVVGVPESAVTSVTNASVRSFLTIAFDR